MSRRDAERLAETLQQGPASGEDASTRGLARLARSLQFSAATPRPGRPQALRQRVLSQAAGVEPSGGLRRAGLIAQDIAATMRYSLRSVGAAGVAAVLLLSGAVGVGTELSVPGDPLYRVKAAYEREQLERATDPSQRGELQLRLAGDRIDEAARAAARERPESATTALTEARTLARAATDTLLLAYRDHDDPTSLQLVPEFVTTHRASVREIGATSQDVAVTAAAGDLLDAFEEIDERVTAVLADCCLVDTAGFSRGLLRAVRQPAGAVDSEGTPPSDPGGESTGEEADTPPDAPVRTGETARDIEHGDEAGDHVRGRLDETTDELDDLLEPSDPPRSSDRRGGEKLVPNDRALDGLDGDAADAVRRGTRGDVKPPEETGAPNVDDTEIDEGPLP